jgi:hypothetical protein
LIFDFRFSIPALSKVAFREFQSPSLVTWRGINQTNVSFIRPFTNDVHAWKSIFPCSNNEQNHVSLQKLSSPKANEIPMVIEIRHGEVYLAGDESWKRRWAS